MASFRDKSETWQHGAPARAAARAQEGRGHRAAGKLVGIVVLVLVVVIAVAAIVLLAALIYSTVTNATVWKIVLVALIVAGLGLAWTRAR